MVDLSSKMEWSDGWPIQLAAGCLCLVNSLFGGYAAFREVTHMSDRVYPSNIFVWYLSDRVYPTNIFGGCDAFREVGLPIQMLSPLFGHSLLLFRWKVCSWCTPRSPAWESLCLAWLASWLISLGCRWNIDNIDDNSHDDAKWQWWWWYRWQFSWWWWRWWLPMT